MQFLTAPEIQVLFQVGRTKAYDIVRKLNKQLDEKGFITTYGKIPLGYFCEHTCFTKEEIMQELEIIRSGGKDHD